MEAGLDRRFAQREARDGSGNRAANQALLATDALRRVVVRQHEQAVGDVLDDVPNSLVLCDAGLLRLPAQDSAMLPVLSSNGVWEPQLAELIDSLIEPESVFLDVGAYVGYHTLRVLSRLGTSGTVVAVEPSRDAAKLLRHNVSANVSAPVAERLVVVERAAWDTATRLGGGPAMGGGLTLLPQDQENVTGASETDAAFDAVRLDRELESIEAVRGQRLSVVKVDIPGRSHRALGGLVRLLRRDRPHIVCTFAMDLTSGFGDDVTAATREFGMWGYDILEPAGQEPITPEKAAATAEERGSATWWLKPRASR